MELFVWLLYLFTSDELHLPDYRSFILPGYLTFESPAATEKLYTLS